MDDITGFEGGQVTTFVEIPTHIKHHHTNISNHNTMWACMLAPHHITSHRTTRHLPQHGCTILTTGCTQGTIRRDSDSVDIPGVSDQVGAEFALVEVPDLYNSMSC